jgi:Fic family protein
VSFDPNKPYNDLPPLPPQTDLQNQAILLKLVSAGRALAELKGIGYTIPNQNILINSLTLEEAKDSSAIENVVTTHDALFKAFTAKSSRIDPETKEVLHYREALWNGFTALQKDGLLTTNCFIKLVQTIKKNQAGIRTTPGTKIVNSTTGEVIFTPPEGEQILRNKLTNLEKYIHSKENVDPLVKLAVIHYQFEAIHPFSDGNGRTGRIINILYLIQQELLDMPILYLSRYIIQNKVKYYKALRGVTEKQNWQAWILFMLEAVHVTANLTKQRIVGIRELLNKTIEKAKAELPSRVYSKDLIELLFHQPYCKGQFLVNAGIAKRKTAAEYLKELEKIGILSSHPIGKEVLYLNIKLLKLLSK